VPRTLGPDAAKPLPGPSRQLLQSPGAAGDINGFNSFYGDPWGTANGYYDPQGPGYIPGGSGWPAACRITPTR
jgi:hypothetical protein